MKNRKQWYGFSAAILVFSMAAASAAGAADGAFSIELSGDNEAWQYIAMANDDEVDTGIVIRSEKSAESAAKGYLYRGGAVTVLDEEDGWVQVRSGDVTGYVRREYLTFGTQAKGLAEYYGDYGVKASWDDVKVFAADDKDAKIVGTAVHGDTWPIVNNNGHWLEVKTDKDETAYVSEEDVSMVILVDSAYPIEEENKTSTLSTKTADKKAKTVSGSEGGSGTSVRAKEAASAEAGSAEDGSNRADLSSGESISYETADARQDGYSNGAEATSRELADYSNAAEAAYEEQADYSNAAEVSYQEQVSYGYVAGAYEEQAGYSEESGYEEQGNYTDDTGYEEQGNYTDDTGYEEQGNYTDDTGYEEQISYTDDTGYVEQAGYTDDTGYEEQGNYTDDTGYEEQISYTDDTDYEEQVSYSEEYIYEESDTGYDDGSDDTEDIYSDDSASYDEVYTQESVSEDLYEDYSSADAGSYEYEESYEGYEDASYDESSYTEYEDYSSQELGYEDYSSQDTGYDESGSAQDTGSSSTSSSDVDLLAAIIYHEAGNQPEEGKIAVGAVVLNRVYSSSFPNTISEVLYQAGQFTPASELASTIASGVPSDCYDAAYAALSGQDPTGGCLYFNTSHGSGVHIGAHWFY